MIKKRFYLNFKSSTFAHGFSLVELLIVISIIGILTTLLMANFIGVRQRARDAQRKSDLRQVQSALELFRSDQGSYPVSAYPYRANNCEDSLKSTDCSTTTYMNKVPLDPMGSSYYNSGHYYYSSPDGSSYVLSACLENSSDSQRTTESPGGTGCSSNSYYVLNNP